MPLDGTPLRGNTQDLRDSCQAAGGLPDAGRCTTDGYSDSRDEQGAIAAPGKGKRMLASAKLLSLSFGAALAIAAAAVAGGPGQQQGPISAYGPSSYLQKGDGPFFPGGCARPGVEYYLEDFEDGDLDTPGLIIPAGQRDILAPGPNTDSIDPNGLSMRASVASAGAVTLVFDDTALNGYPEQVGFVITDTNGAENTTFTVFVIDGDNNNASFNFSNIGDNSAANSADDDVFIGVSSANGIAQVQILSPAQLWEIDHIQYTRDATYSLPTRGDTDGSGTGDILFHQPGAALTAWFLNDVVEDPTELDDVLSASWTVQGFGDFDGDCDDDILFRNNTNPSKVQLWRMENGAVTAKNNISTSLGTSWKISGIADFDGDGNADILLEQDSGKKLKIWFMDGISIVSNVTVNTGSFDVSLYTVATCGDVDGDGKADIIWRKNSNGDLRYFRMAGSTILQSGLIATLSTTWVSVGGGDLNGDGILDLGFRSSANGNVLLGLLDNTFHIATETQLSLAAGFSFIGFPDVNGDGKADLVWRKDSTGAIVRWKMNGLTVTSSKTVGAGPNTAGVKTYAER